MLNFTINHIKMKRHILTAVLATLWLGACAQPMMRPQGPLNEFSAMEGTTALQYNLPMERNIESRAGYGPAFYIFPDQKLDESTALTLARELNIIDLAAKNGECPNCGYQFQNNAPKMGGQKGQRGGRMMQGGQMPGNQAQPNGPMNGQQQAPQR